VSTASGVTGATIHLQVSLLRRWARCPLCGRESGSSRVPENHLSLKITPGPPCAGDELPDLRSSSQGPTARHATWQTERRMVTRTERFPHIISDPAIQGGAAVVAGTRLPVRTGAFYWHETHDRKRILRNYPQLTDALLDEVIRYYRAHQAAIDAELRAEEEAEQRADDDGGAGVVCWVGTVPAAGSARRLSSTSARFRAGWLRSRRSRDQPSAGVRGLGCRHPRARCRPSSGRPRRIWGALLRC